MTTKSPPPASSFTDRRRHRIPCLLSLLERRPVIIALLIRLLLVYALPLLLDDGLLLKGVRYTDIDYDVFTDAALHVAHGRSPYDRHTYRYTPFLAQLLALPLGYDVDGGSGSNLGGIWNVIFSIRYFGKILFCVADVICGYIIVVLRRRQRRRRLLDSDDATTPIHNTQSDTMTTGGWKDIVYHYHYYSQYMSPELNDALWWLYNPLPINICTRGSAESLVVLLPVLATVAVADANVVLPSLLSSSSLISSEGDKEIKSITFMARQKGGRTSLAMARACTAGIFHGIGIHFKLYPVIYTVSFMANFSRQQQQQQRRDGSLHAQERATNVQLKFDTGWRHCLCDYRKDIDVPTSFPWTNPMKIAILAFLWVQRLFFTISSVLFLAFSIGTAGSLTYLAVHYHGQKALDEGLLYHFQRVDHRHNYSMYWYWIYLARGRAAAVAGAAVSSEVPSSTASLWGYIPLVPQILILGFSSLGIAPYDLSFALFCQTFAFVAFNKVITAQYFTWYLCLLPLCSDRVNWQSKRMYIALGILFLSIIVWLLSAFTLEMLGWRTHRHVWLASIFFFIANVNLLRSIVMGYNKKSTASSALSDDNSTIQKMKAS